MDPSQTPALEPPEGLKPNFSEYYPINGSQIALATVCLALCTVSIAARSCTRAIILKQFDLSDWAIILSGAFFASFTAVKLVANTYGQGQHQWNVNLVNMSNVLWMANIIEILYGPTMFFAKYAVLRQIEDIFYKHRRNTLAFKAIWLLILANLFLYVAILFSFIFACVPREKIAHPDLDGRCIDAHVSIIATSAINVVSDITILLIPLAAVWRLHMAWKMKVGAAAVFAVGIFATIASIVRLVYSVELTQSEDVTWSIEPVGSWALAEFTTVILVACFPLFPRLFGHLLRRDRGSSYQLSDDIAPNKNRFQQPRLQHRAIDADDHGSMTALREHERRSNLESGD